MSFEEEFPSLKDKKQAVCDYDGNLDYIKNCENWKYPENPVVFKDGDDLFISIKDIEENCLDKQKVKKIIDKVFDKKGVIIEYPPGTNCWKFSEIKEELLKELGL